MITFTIGGEKHVLPIDSSKTLRVGSVSPSVALEVEEMTKLEEMALELWRPGAAAEVNMHNFSILGSAFLEMRERHEAYKQEVSDAVEQWCSGKYNKHHPIARFIIPKPDPLVEVMNEMGFGMSKTASEEFRAALAARGLEIREKQP